MLEVDKPNENDGALITTIHEKAVENVCLDIAKDCVINHIIVNKHVTALYDDWHTGTITWCNTKLEYLRKSKSLDFRIFLPTMHLKMLYGVRGMFLPFCENLG